MNKFVSLFKKLNPDFRLLLLIIFLIPTLGLVFYLLSKVFTFLSDIFFVIFEFVMGLISVIESLIPPIVSEHSGLIFGIVVVVLFLFSIFKTIDDMINGLRKEIQELKNRIEKIERERR